MKEKILIIEDDQALAQQITAQLTDAGFDVQWMQEGKLLTPTETAGLRLVILDLMLPGTYGMDILKDLRAYSDVPVLVLSGRNDTFDKVRALKLGADDYMTKPFWPEELRERVQARLRRPNLQRGGEVRLGELEINFTSRVVKRAGETIDLTRVEFELLGALARRPGAAVSRAWFLSHVLDPERGNERTLDVHFSRLRKKLGENNGIETVWGVGYRLAVEEPT
jgi:two-component system response regulator MtrA